MSLATQISSLASRIAQEVKAVRSELASGLAGKASTSHTHAISSLSDAAISAPSSGQVLSYNGTAWANATPSAPSMATGTSFPSSPTAGQQFFRTDVKIAYIYNGSGWDELSRPNRIEPLLLIGI